MANALLTPISYAPARSKLAGFDSDSGNCFSPQFTLTFQASKKVAGGLLLSGINKFANRYICFSAVDGIESVNSSSTDSEQTKVVPMPIVHIIQDADSDATVVEVSFGDRLGALLDTMKSLKELGLDVAKGSVITENSVIQTKFYITLSSSGRKVEDPDLLEKIRLSIITNLLKYHPYAYQESSERLAMGETFGVKAPPEKLNIELATRVKVKDDGPLRSLLYVETADRPGLMLDLIKTITDINIDVESAEIDTEGLMAKDKFYVSYRGKALNASLSQVLTNCLRYYLKRPGTIEDSY